MDEEIGSTAFLVLEMYWQICEFSFLRQFFKWISNYFKNYHSLYLLNILKSKALEINSKQRN